MKRTGTIILLLCALLSVNCYAQQAAAPSALKEFQDFWAEFRSAVKADDKDKIASLTAFPFKTRGTLDSEPVKKLNKASFLKILDQLLDADPGLSMKADKMRSFIDRKAEITNKDFGESGPGGGRAHIGDFVFEKVGGKWAFTFAYVEE